MRPVTVLVNWTILLFTAPVARQAYRKSDGLAWTQCQLPLRCEGRIRKTFSFGDGKAAWIGIRLTDSETRNIQICFSSRFWRLIWKEWWRGSASAYAYIFLLILGPSMEHQRVYQQNHALSVMWTHCKRTYITLHTLISGSTVLLFFCLLFPHALTPILLPSLRFVALAFHL